MEGVIVSLIITLVALPLVPVYVGADLFARHVLNDDSLHVYDELVIPTGMKNKDLLDEAIKKYEKTLPTSEKNLFNNVMLPGKGQMNEKIKFRFNKEENCFEAVACRVTGSKRSIEHVENIFNIYTGLVQQKVYERVKTKLEETNVMTLDNEEVLEDESIVLTVGVN